MEIAQDFEELWNRTGSTLALQKIACELNALRMILRDEAHSVVQDIAIAEVALAEGAALCADGAKMLEHLHAADSWTLDMAEKIDAAHAAAAIRLSRQT